MEGAKISGRGTVVNPEDKEKKKKKTEEVKVEKVKKKPEPPKEVKQDEPKMMYGDTSCITLEQNHRRRP